MKLVVEMSFYNDGDWGFGDIDWLTEHTSRYFDNDFYEYTNHDEDGYKLSFRRVFDITESVTEVVLFLQSFIANLRGKESNLECVWEFLERAKGDIMKNAQYDVSYTYRDFLDGNTEADVKIYTTDKVVPKIKEIIYEEQAADTRKTEKRRVTVIKKDTSEVLYQGEGERTEAVIGKHIATGWKLLGVEHLPIILPCRSLWFENYDDRTQSYTLLFKGEIHELFPSD